MPPVITDQTKKDRLFRMSPVSKQKSSNFFKFLCYGQTHGDKDDTFSCKTKSLVKRTSKITNTKINETIFYCHPPHVLNQPLIFPSNPGNSQYLTWKVLWQCKPSEKYNSESSSAHFEYLAIKTTEQWGLKFSFAIFIFWYTPI